MCLDKYLFHTSLLIDIYVFTHSCRIKKDKYVFVFTMELKRMYVYCSESQVKAVWFIMKCRIR